MSKAESAAAWIEALAADDSHGYDQGSRWGPDYDCSSSAIKAYQQAGVPLTCTYTGNMRGNMLSNGFKDVTAQVNLATSAGLVRGDVLLNEKSHTAIYIGNGRLVNAGGNEFGGVSGGKSGDQTGKEIRVMGYYNFPWDCVLRYIEKGSGSTPSAPASPEKEPVKGGTYVVQSGDTLTAIAARFGTTVVELARINGIANVNLIHVGDVLKLSEESSSAEPAPVSDTVTVSLTLKASAWSELKKAAQKQGVSESDLINTLFTPAV